MTRTEYSFFLGGLSYDDLMQEAHDNGIAFDKHCPSDMLRDALLEAFDTHNPPE